MTQKKRLIFKVKNLEKTFGSHEAVNIGKLDIHPGTIYGLIGNVGSGKTTLLNLLAGRLKPTNGMLFYDNKPYKTNWLGKLIPNTEVFFAGNSGIYNSSQSVGTFIIKQFGNKKNVIKKRYFNKGTFQNIWGRNLSRLTNGELQWLGMILSIENDPRVLLIDDYGIYFDSNMENNFRSQLLSMNRRLGTTIVLAAPSDIYLRKFSSVLVYLDNGHISKIRPGQTGKVGKKRRRYS
tara:strand:+ start:899 stop:1603 length:705 start_codon:yes stop_codon:yes gene_type:complete